jgi:hypothetical protein
MRLIKNTKDLLIIVIIVLLLLSPFFWIINTYYYIDPIHLSFIKLDKDTLRGNRDTIKKAIKQIKKEDRESYKILTRYINRISEKYCIIADHKTNRGEYLAGLDLPGCYVRGAKTIYLRPDKNDSNQVIDTRAETIKKFSIASKEFWDNYQK